MERSPDPPDQAKLKEASLNDANFIGCFRILPFLVISFSL